MLEEYLIWVAERIQIESFMVFDYGFDIRKVRFPDLMEKDSFKFFNPFSVREWPLPFRERVFTEWPWCFSEPYNMTRINRT